jgi:glycerophosphoryl diester phosphodiesterase
VRVVGKQGFDPSNLRPVLVLGHRGTGVGEGENTLGGFADALRLGADGIELDVRRTADGALAVHHDAVVPGLGPLADLRVRDLPGHIPLLEAALDVCASGVVNVEVKNGPHEPGFDPDELAAREVATLLSAQADRLAGGALIVSSFSPASLDAVLATAPEVPVGLLTVPAVDQDQALALAVERGYAALHPHHGAVTPELAGAVHAAGLLLNTWTVNEPQRAAWLASCGADAVITDRVADVAAAVDALVPGRPGEDPAGPPRRPGSPAP